MRTQPLAHGCIRASLRSSSFRCGSAPLRRFPSHALVVALLRQQVSRTAVVAQTAPGCVAAITPTAGLDRASMLLAQTFRCRRNFETKFAAAIPISRLPPRPQDGLAMHFATPLPRRRNVLRAITLRATGVAMPGAPEARPDRSPMNFAKPHLARAGARLGSSFCFHSRSLTPVDG